MIDWVWRSQRSREVYHDDPGCSALDHARTPTMLRRSTAEDRGLRLCTRCASDIGGTHRGRPDTLAARLEAMDPDAIGGGEPA
ncbi:MAG: hypothetical protein ACOCUO_00895 [archaeon]